MRKQFTEKQSPRIGWWPLAPTEIQKVREMIVKIAKCFPERSNFETKGLFTL